MKTVLSFIFSVFIFSTIAHAEKINSEYPICKTQEYSQSFAQAKMFSNVNIMESLIEDGSCVFVEPDIKATVLERTVFPKVLVFVPYKSPITGYTSPENLK